ncbi:unnamed protein product [Ceratitis capitata]|uniref:(Mediterranean fruit fly) hypothetical protein n=1 Tax=Ceratitis capitata TaxID=7213 RepID=A0A811V3T6_CERCA|nr:unnamed protein product [Ceratitis capitata]
MASEVSQTPVPENKVAEEAAAAAAATKPESAATETVATKENTAESNGADTANAQEKGDDTKASAGGEDTKKDGDNATTAAATNSKPEPAPKFNVHKTNFEKDVIYLYQFSRTPLLPSLSPYCLKVETWLRLAGLKYEVFELQYTRNCTKISFFLSQLFRKKIFYRKSKYLRSPFSFG